MTPDQIDRYARHILVREIGGPGQKQLLGAHITLIGAGALGGMAALSLAGAGIGRLTIYDDDKVERSNLHRQLQFGENDIGNLKVDALRDRISKLNGDCEVKAVPERWERGYDLPKTDVIIDGSDNFETRFALNAEAMERQTPLVIGAVGGWQAQVLAVSSGRPCYQCFVPAAPPQAGDCADIGTLGPVTAMVANMQALLAIRIILGLTEGLFEKVWRLNGLTGDWKTSRLVADPECPACGQTAAIPE